MCCDLIGVLRSSAAQSYFPLALPMPLAMFWMLSVLALCVADERALRDDTECTASDCALNALQRLGFKSRSSVS